MRRRTAALVIGVLAAVCLGLVLSVAYPFTTSAPHAATPGDKFTVGEADAFSATGAITVDGETRLAFDGAVAADGTWYQRVVERDVVSEEYRSPDGPVYRRVTVEDGEAADQRRDQLAEQDRVSLLRESRDGDCVTFVTRRKTTSTTEPVSGTASVFVNNLWVAGYEATGTDSGVTTYRPRPGWYESGATYRLTDVSGTVRADAESAAVTRANVSWQLTRGGTYAQYVLSSLVGDGPTASRTTFSFDGTAPDLERPGWASDDEPNSSDVPRTC
ncbi:hypothetical protein [Haloglomus litoreum]|uniref:hypothetical protein n=1 Tax=Haloglomus litoreum TaxID=3034026 RepID=UPI0023E8F75C|nr:hypothetical protein [Haloglomus sp. DT116]